MGFIMITLVIASVILSEVHCLRILGVFPYPGKSHFYVFEPYLLELARRGHDVTVISHFPQRIPIENYTDISLAGKEKILENALPIERSYLSIVMVAAYILKMGPQNCKVMLEDEDVQNLWKSQTKFDVVVTELFNSDCSLGLSYKLRAPVVGFSSHTLPPWLYDRLGVPSNPSYVSYQLLVGGTKPTLIQRIERSIFIPMVNFLYKVLSQRVDQNTLAEYFDDIPPLDELAGEIKIVLAYKYFLLTGPVIQPEIIKEVGGYHVKTPKELPHDIKKFIEESEHGVIYISFGSMLKAASIPRDKLEAIIAAVSELPQRVVWKWDESTLPGNPKNIYISNWLPQNDILAHPNVLAFYSHCGVLGAIEAIHHGVPVVGMPIFGDQPSNAAAIEEGGLGVQIQINELTKENLLQKLNTVLKPEFRRKVKLVSAAWHDRPVSAMDSAIFWTEFAARHSHFTFRSPAADVPLYKYFNLDILFIFSFTFLALFKIVKFLYTNLRRQSHCKQQKNMKSKKM